MNYGFYENVIYLHSSKVGKKIDIIKQNPKVCFEITEDMEILESEKACNFGTRYKSVIGTGIIEIINSEDEKIQGLNIIMRHHKKSEKEWDYSKLSLEKIVILKLKIESLTGKISG